VYGAYLDTGPPSYADVTKVAQAFVKAAPERMVWGSDRPSAPQKPDDAVLLDLLFEWAPDEETRHRILVENPEARTGSRRQACGLGSGAISERIKKSPAM
jgi:predicted TIM-barrel fold metal-dependent hydrolase